MGLFDGPSAALFRTDASGARVFAPLGRYGRVYAVDDVAAARITLLVRRYYQVSLVAIIGTQIAVGWRWNVFLVAPLSLASYFLLLARELRSLPPASGGYGALPPVNRREMQTRMATAIGAGRLWALLAVGSLFVAGGAWMAIRGDRAGYLVAAFFGLCCAIYAWQLVLLYRSRAL
jgi:hypothetical protein